MKTNLPPSCICACSNLFRSTVAVIPPHITWFVHAFTLTHIAAGQEEFDAITRTYYRGAGAAVIAFSTTDRASFEAVQMWKGKIEQECGDIAMSLVQNKVDLIDQSVASAEEVEAMARRLGLRLYRTCVKENVNVAEVFMYLADMNNKKAQAGAIQQNVAQSIAPPMSAVQQQGFMQAADAPVSQVGPAPVAAPQEAPKNLASNMPMTVDLGPSKKRTKGKKSISCSIA